MNTTNHYESTKTTTIYLLLSSLLLLFFYFSLTSLLDHAESISVYTVYCMIPVALPDSQRKSIIKSFQMMSFQLLHPLKNPLHTNNGPQYSFLKYCIHSDSDSDQDID